MFIIDKKLSFLYIYIKRIHVFAVKLLNHGAKCKIVVKE